jgi:hypothetical protein
MAKVPRLRDEYIARHGVDPFIEKFTSIIADHQQSVQEKLHKEKLLQ